MNFSERKDVVVVGNDHYNTLNVVRALGSADFNVDVYIISDKKKSFVLKSKYVSRSFIVNEDEIVNALLQDKSGEKKVLISTYDKIAAILDNSYNELSMHYVLPSVGHRQGGINLMMDKEKQTECAAKVGMKVPKTILIELDKNLDVEEFSLSYPCIIKPVESFKGSKNDFRFCRDENELQQDLNSIKGMFREVLVQQFIPNDEVILIGGVRTEEGKNYIHGEINKYKHSSAIHNMGLCCLGFWMPQTRLGELCDKLLEEIDYYGCYSIEFIRSHSIDNSNGDYFIEINLRTDGLFYFYTEAGVNLPAIWASSCYGNPIKLSCKKTKVFGMNEFLYLKSSLSPSSIFDFMKTNVFSVARFNDIKPLIYKILTKI